LTLLKLLIGSCFPSLLGYVEDGSRCTRTGREEGRPRRSFHAGSIRLRDRNVEVDDDKNRLVVSEDLNPQEARLRVDPASEADTSQQTFGIRRQRQSRTHAHVIY
jgi:hypothetical protein